MFWCLYEVWIWSDRSILKIHYNAAVLICMLFFYDFSIWSVWCLFSSVCSGSGQTGSDEGETERSQVPHWGGILEATDIFCQWFEDKLFIDMNMGLFWINALMQIFKCNSPALYFKMDFFKDMLTCFFNALNSLICHLVAVIQALGEHLKLRQQVIATATVYFKRFYARWAGRCLGYSLLFLCKNVYLSSRLMALFKYTCMKVKESSWLVSRYSLKSIDPVLMAPTCVFLASKVEVNTVSIWQFLLKDA